jgi:hypothetical protein
MLPGDILGYLIENGPSSAYQICAGLNATKYHGRLTPLKVAHVSRGLRGAGKVGFTEKECGRPAIYEAVVE